MNPATIDPDFVILYVDSPVASAKFYGDLLGRAPAQASPNFAMFALATGMKLGLWSRHEVEPKPGAAANGAASATTEIALSVADAPALRALHADWTKRGLGFAQPPTRMDFGDTFVALDPDGHRLRVVAPKAA